MTPLNSPEGGVLAPSTNMKPMLAATVQNVNTLRYPLLASPKLDGVRAFVENGVVLSRSRKPIPNLHVQEKFKALEGYDGELIVGDPTAKDCYRATMSGVMSVQGEPPVHFMVFDHVWFKGNFFEYRLAHVKDEYRLPHKVVEIPEDLLSYEELILSTGYEGVILRSPTAPYKFGRSTLNEQGMLKLKRFLDDEGVVVGFDELMHNGNPATTNALGHAEHSSHKAGLEGRNTLGALRVEWRGMEFGIGTGFDDAERQKIWEQRSAHLGLAVKFKYLPIGVKDKPRHPVFLGWRYKEDM